MPIPEPKEVVERQIALFSNETDWEYEDWKKQDIWVRETFKKSSDKELLLLEAARSAKANPNIRNFYRKVPFKAELLTLIYNRLCVIKLIHEVEGLFLLMPSGMATRVDDPSKWVSQVLRTTMKLRGQEIQRMVCEQLPRCFGDELFSSCFREIYEDIFAQGTSSAFLHGIFSKSTSASREGFIRRRMKIDLIYVDTYDKKDFDGEDRSRSSGVHTLSTLCASFEDLCHTKVAETNSRMTAADIAKKVKERETATDTVDRLTGYVLLISAHGVDGCIQSSDLVDVNLQDIINEVSEMYSGIEKVIIVQACRDSLQVNYKSWNIIMGIEGRDHPSSKLTVKDESKVHVVLTTAKGEASYRDLFFHKLKKQLYQPENNGDFGLCLLATINDLFRMSVYPEVLPFRFPITIPFIERFK